MLLKIHHETSYHYDAPVDYALQQLRLRPKSRAGQSVNDWNLIIEGGYRELEFQDWHNNHVDLIAIEPGHQEVKIRIEGEVETTDQAGVLGHHGGFAPLWIFSRTTELTKPGALVRKLVKGIGNDFADDISRMHALSAGVLEAITYQVDHTHSATTSEEALRIGHGVCQDHAHVFITAARLLGFPARYVSGYLMLTDRVSQDASHAWAEVHLHGLGWVGFDVSNGISPDERHVRIATGLDYRDAAPVSGLRFGDASESMVVSLQVEQ